NKGKARISHNRRPAGPVAPRLAPPVLVQLHWQLLGRHPFSILIKGFPARSLTIDLRLNILFLRLTTETDHGGVAIRVFYRCRQQETVLWIDLILMWKQFSYQRSPCFSVFWKLAGCQEKTRCSIAQYIMIIHFIASEFRHWDRINFWRGGLTTLQQFARVFTFAVGTTKVLAKPAGLQLHLAAALIALECWSLIAFKFKSALFYFISRAIWIVTTDVNLAVLIQQVAVHRRITDFAAQLGAQLLGFSFLISVRINNLMARHEVHRVLAALLRWQAIPRAA